MTDDEFCALFPTIRNDELAARMGVSLPTLARRARALGVRKDPEAVRAHKRGPKSAAHRAKIASALSGRTFTDEARAKMSASRTGKVQTPEHRAAISAANKGKPKPASFVEKARGRRLPDEVKAARKARMAERGTLPAGEKHYGWKGGIVPRAFARFSDERYGAWRQAVLERDTYTCQTCSRVFIPGQKGLHAHHIKPYAKHADVRYDVANGVTLCTRCHRSHHNAIHIEDYERMEKVACACGCGEVIYPINMSGQRVRYKQYHSRRGQALSAESRAKIAASLIGRKRAPFSDEHRQRMTDARRRRPASDKPSPLKGWRNNYMTEDEFIVAYTSMNSRQIAAYCHVADSTVHYWAKKLGLPPRYHTVA